VQGSKFGDLGHNVWGVGCVVWIEGCRVLADQFTDHLLRNLLQPKPPCSRPNSAVLRARASRENGCHLQRVDEPAPQQLTHIYAGNTWVRIYGEGIPGSVSLRGHP